MIRVLYFSLKIPQLPVSEARAGEDQRTRHESLQAANYPEFDSMVGFWMML